MVLSCAETSKLAGVVTSYFNDQSGFIELNSEYYENPSRVLSRYREFNDLEHRFDAQAGYVQVKQQLPDFGLTAFFGRAAIMSMVLMHVGHHEPRLFTRPSGDTRHVLKRNTASRFVLRSPMSFYSNDDITSGNANLSSEVIKTTGVSVVSSRHTVEKEVVLFDNALEDFIDRVMVNEQQQALPLRMYLAPLCRVLR